MPAKTFARLSRVLVRTITAVIDRIAPIPQPQPRSAFAPVELPAFDPARLQRSDFSAPQAQTNKE